MRDETSKDCTEAEALRPLFSNVARCTASAVVGNDILVKHSRELVKHLLVNIQSMFSRLGKTTPVSEHRRIGYRITGCGIM